MTARSMPFSSRIATTWAANASGEAGVHGSIRCVNCVTSSARTAL